MTSMIHKFDLPAPPGPQALAQAGLGARLRAGAGVVPDREWSEMRRSLQFALSMFGDSPDDCTETTLRMGCAHLRNALNAAVRWETP